jgi:FKBP12-rapamycin complex-associated protein
MHPYRKYPDLLPLLLGALKDETSWGIRHAALQLLGVLGALDPHRAAELEAERGAATGPGARDRGAADVMPGVGTSPDNFFPSAAFAALTSILRDASLSAHHVAAVQAVIIIVEALGTRSVPFLPDIMPPFLGLLRAGESGMREFMLQQLGTLVSVVKSHIRPYLHDIIALIRESWHSPLLVPIIKLVEEVSRVLADDFKQYLPELIPPLLNALASDRSEGRPAALRVLRALEALGINLDDYLYLVVPAVVRLAEQAEAPLNVRQAALATLARLCRRLNVADYAARIVHPLMRILTGPWPDLRREAMEVCLPLSPSRVGTDGIGGDRRSVRWCSSCKPTMSCSYRWSRRCCTQATACSTAATKTSSPASSRASRCPRRRLTPRKPARRRQHSRGRALRQPSCP